MRCTAKQIQCKSTQCNANATRCNATQCDATQRNAIATQYNATHCDCNAMRLQCDANEMPLQCQRDARVAQIRHNTVAMQIYTLPQTGSMFGGSAARNQYEESHPKEPVGGSAGVMAHQLAIPGVAGPAVGSPWGGWYASGPPLE